MAIFIIYGVPVVLGFDLLARYSARPPLFTTLTVDPVASGSMYSWNVMIGNLLKKGYFPIWNPYSLTGAPFLANMQSAVLFPFQIIEALLPPHLWSISYLLRFYAAALFTFFYLKKIGLHSSIFSGTLFFYYKLEPMFNSIIMLPIVLSFLKDS